MKITAMAPLLMIALLCVGNVLAQEEEMYPRFDVRSDLPDVDFNARPVGLQAGLFPSYYKTHSARADQRWVQENDSTLRAFWKINSTDILGTLSDYSGISWIEQEFDIFLVRYYHTEGEGTPTIIPLGGIKSGQLTEAMPSDARQTLNLIYQLAHRMLDQADQPEEGLRQPAAFHPLWQPGPYRRDNLAMLLALVVAQQIIGLDSTFNAYRSEFWEVRHPGRGVFEQYLLKDWILTPDHPLAVWVAQEPYGSGLVVATRPPRRPRPQNAADQQASVEGLPIKGELGMSMTTDSRGRLMVDKLDVSRLAFANGLEEGDVIRQVDGARVRTHKELAEAIMSGLEQGGATLSVLRQGQPITIVMQPLDLTVPGDEFLWDTGEDSLFAPPAPPPVEDSL